MFKKKKLLYTQFDYLCVSYIISTDNVLTCHTDTTNICNIVGIDRVEYQLDNPITEDEISTNLIMKLCEYHKTDNIAILKWWKNTNFQ